MRLELQQRYTAFTTQCDNTVMNPPIFYGKTGAGGNPTIAT